MNIQDITIQFIPAEGVVSISTEGTQIVDYVCKDKLDVLAALDDYMDKYWNQIQKSELD